FYSNSIVFGTTTLTNQPATFFNYGAEMFLVKYDACGTFKWAKKAGGNNEMRARGVATDANGNVFVTGYFNSDTLSFGTSPIKLVNRSYWDGFLVKYDSLGTVLWAKLLGGDDIDRAYGLTTDAAGNAYVTGTFSSTYIVCGTDSTPNLDGANSQDVFVAKFDANGNSQWITCGTGDYDDLGYGVGVDAAGNVYVGGSFGSTNIQFGSIILPLNSYNDIFLAKLDMNGTPQWVRTAGSSDNDQCLSLATDAAGNSFITGYLGYNTNGTFGTITVVNPNASYEAYIAKYDANGTALWANGIIGNDYTYSQGSSVRLDAAGNPYIIGFYNSDSLKLGPVTLYNNSLVTYGGGDTVYDIFVAKYKSSNGYLNWARTAGDTRQDFGDAIATGPNNALYIAGEFYSPSITFAGITLTTTDTDGDVFIASNIATSTVTPDICMVTVDSTSTHNIIYWDKTTVSGVDSFKIYREDVTNIYKHIGTVAYDSLGEYHDYDTVLYANPNATTKRYKLATVDTCGLQGGLSNYHNTIYIIYAGGGQYTWNPLYTIENTANPVNNYVLMRDNLSTGVWVQVAFTAGTQQTIVDPGFATFPNASYYVETIWGISCDPARAIVNTSRSNVKGIAQGGIGFAENALSNSVTVAPNPVSHETQIRSASRISSVELYNSIGQLIIGEKVNNVNSYTLSFSELAAGVYHLKIRTEAGIVYKKLLKQ
ncbi:MAG: T9SS type A sorting domain-containing protein, partial [Bacteroidia bacterium]|nr:T9SS type A sorting domain-containing protein [Bacteroidia bacterium]